MVCNLPVVVHSLVCYGSSTNEPLHDGVTEVMQSSNYSSFNRLIRVTAYVLRFIKNLKSIINGNSVLTSIYLQAVELTEAEQVCMDLLYSKASILQ